LQQWQEFVLKCADGDESIDLREIANKIYKYFEEDNLYEIFEKYTKKQGIGNTFLLLEKK